MFGVDDIVAGVIASTTVEVGKVVLGGLLSDKTIPQKLDKAFNEALKKWSINRGIREIEFSKINEYKQKLIEVVLQHTDSSSLDSNTKELVDIFRDEIINNIDTYSIINYLQNQEEITILRTLKKDVSELKKSKNTDGYIGGNAQNLTENAIIQSF